MAGNTYKNNTVKDEPKERVKLNININFDFMKDNRFRIAIGLVLIVVAMNFLMSFIYFLFTGENDYSIVESLGEIEFYYLATEVDNSWGLVGATLSQYLIMRWFGIGVFSLVPILLMYAAKFLFNKPMRLLPKVLNISFFMTIWLSITLGYFYYIGDDSNSYLGHICGGIGYDIAFVLNGLVGWGTVFIQLLSLSIYLVYFFNIRSFKQLLEPLVDGVDETAFEEENELQEHVVIDHDEQEPLYNDGTETYEAEDDSPQEEEALVFEEPIIKPTPVEEKIIESKPIEPIQPVSGGKINFDVSVIKPIKKPVPLADLEIELEMPIIETPVVEEETAGDKLDIELEKSIADRIADGEVENYDPKLDLGTYRYPPIDLLEDRGGSKMPVTREELEENKDKIVNTLANYKIGIQHIKATIGPTVTLYEIIPQAGVKISKIKNLEDDIALSLAALGIRIIAPIPGKGTIGIEVPNIKPEAVSIREVIGIEKFTKSDMDLPMVLGKTITNEVFMVDLAKMPHVLMAGATGQGKSVGLNVMLASLLYAKHPSQLKFVLVDPKKVELSIFSKIEKHFLAKLPDTEEAIITDTTKVIHTLNSLCIEMDARYDLLKNALCRNIKEYNGKFIKRKLNPNNGHRFLPYIVLVIDELADLMMTAGKEVETPIARLAQLARAIGIHLIVATQRPSVNVITGIIKANFPARCSFRVTSKIDSRTILDAGGADQLIGKGDMLFMQGSESTRVQCAFIDTPEVEDLVNFIGDQKGYETAYLLPEYVDENNGNGMGIDLADRDVLFEDAARTIVLHQQGSTSLIQRKMKLGYNRAGRIIDQLEAAGIVGPFGGSKARDVLVPDEFALEQLLNELNGKG
jgi:S-DNA-T family DNA segregation ATPase FtsK/SpoIIIE